MDPKVTTGQGQLLPVSSPKPATLDTDPPSELDRELTLAWLSGSSGSEAEPGEHLAKAIRITAANVSWFPPYAQRVLAALEDDTS